MSSITLDQFRSEMLAAGYDEVLERVWPPNTVLGTHSHPFEAHALVVEGEMWLDVAGEGPRRLQSGDRFRVAANVPHDERYGAEGATYWVARKAA